MNLASPMTTAKGGYACDQVRHEAEPPALFVHCCHCTRCQRQSGAAFALNAMIEASWVRLTSGALEVIDTPSESGKGQQVCRCPACKTALWSIYAGPGLKFLFLRVGAMDQPDLLPPDIHIFTDSKEPWVQLPEGAPSVVGCYDRKDYWPPYALERVQQAIASE